MPGGWNTKGQPNPFLLKFMLSEHSDLSSNASLLAAANWSSPHREVTSGKRWNCCWEKTNSSFSLSCYRMQTETTGSRDHKQRWGVVFVEKICSRAEFSLPGVRTKNSDPKLSFPLFSWVLFPLIILYP